MMKTFKITFFIILISYKAFASDFSQLNMDDYNINKANLEKGDIQLFYKNFKDNNSGEKKQITGIILINAPVNLVWNLISDWDSMGEYVPCLKYYKTLYQVEYDKHNSIKRSIIEGYIKIPLPFINKKINLFVNFYEGSQSISWKLLTDEQKYYYKNKGIKIKRSNKYLKKMEGFTRINQYYDNNNQTIFYYVLKIEISVPVPFFVKKFLYETSLKGFMQSIKIRSENFMSFEN